MGSCHIRQFQCLRGPRAPSSHRGCNGTSTDEGSETHGGPEDRGVLSNIGCTIRTSCPCACACRYTMLIGAVIHLLIVTSGWSQAEQLGLQDQINARRVHGGWVLDIEATRHGGEPGGGVIVRERGLLVRRSGTLGVEGSVRETG